jgi:hypothetical protein
MNATQYDLGDAICGIQPLLLKANVTHCFHCHVHVATSGGRILIKSALFIMEQTASH